MTAVGTVRAAVLALLTAEAAVPVLATPASARVVPPTTTALDVRASDATAALVLPASDLATASGIDHPWDGAPLDGDGAGAVADHLEQHLRGTSAFGPWTVVVEDAEAPRRRPSPFPPRR